MSVRERLGNWKGLKETKEIGQGKAMRDTGVHLRSRKKNIIKNVAGHVGKICILDSVFDNNFVPKLSFLNLILILWLHKKISLFLGDTHTKEFREKMSATSFHVVISDDDDNNINNIK